jgi:hypothetical protein
VVGGLVEGADEVAAVGGGGVGEDDRGVHARSPDFSFLGRAGPVAGRRLP